MSSHLIIMASAALVCAACVGVYTVCWLPAPQPMLEMRRLALMLERASQRGAHNAGVAQLWPDGPVVNLTKCDPLKCLM